MGKHVPLEVDSVLKRLKCLANSRRLLMRQKGYAASLTVRDWKDVDIFQGKLKVKITMVNIIMSDIS